MVLLRLALLYLFLPAFLFQLLWLDWRAAAVLVILTGLLFKELIKHCTVPETENLFSKHNVLCCLLLFIFLLTTGHGGFLLATGYDIPWRNAIYYDLIKYPWPVVYENIDCALIYYVGYWLAPAGISSLLGLGEVGSNVVLFAWTYLGLVIFYLLISSYIQAKGKEKWLVVTILVFWSGLNLFGVLFKSIYSSVPLQINAHNWFASWVFQGGLFLRTTFDSMANVYNQYLHVGICTVLFLMNKEKRELYAALGLLAVPCSPVGFLGLFFLITGYFFVRLPNWLKSEGWKDIGKAVCSKANLLACYCILIPFYQYYTLNGATSFQANLPGASSVLFNWFGSTLNVILLLIYYVVFFGIYGLLLYKENKKEPLYWIALIILLLLPHFRVGSSSDLNYNASMPSFMFIMLLVMKEIIKGYREKYFYGRRLFLVMALIIAMTTPMMQVTSTMRRCFLEKKIAVTLDDPQVGGTFANKNAFEYRNFISYYFRGSTFYTYFTRTKYPRQPLKQR